MDRDDRWGEPTPVYIGDGLIDLHDGKGTQWKRTPEGVLYPLCACHCPPGLIEAVATAETKQAKAERAAQRERYEPAPEAPHAEPTSPHGEKSEPPRRFDFLRRRRP